jgi:outer membrane protein assembly factor BamE (lipoprotein component of BamABCDE complex)
MKTIFSFSKVTLLFVCIAIAACATSQVQALKSVEVGMDKADVLEKVGNPTRKTREFNQDRWSYELDSENKSQVTYVYFSEGKVTYVGPGEKDIVAPHTPAAPKSDSSFKSVGQ